MTNIRTLVLMAALLCACQPERYVIRRADLAAAGGGGRVAALAVVPSQRWGWAPFSRLRMGEGVPYDGRLLLVSGERSGARDGPEEHYLVDRELATGLSQEGAPGAPVQRLLERNLVPTTLDAGALRAYHLARYGPDLALLSIPARGPNPSAMVISGSIILAAGVAFLAAGGALWSKSLRPCAGFLCGLGDAIGGLTLLGVGGAHAATGVPLVAVGAARRSARGPALRVSLVGGGLRAAF